MAEPNQVNWARVAWTFLAVAFLVIAYWKPVELLIVPIFAPGVAIFVYTLALFGVAFDDEVFDRFSVDRFLILSTMLSILFYAAIPVVSFWVWRLRRPNPPS